MRWEREGGLFALRKKGEQGLGPLEAEGEWVPNARLGVVHLIRSTKL